jgi:nitroreductase
MKDSSAGAFFDVIRTQRAHRAFSADPVPEALVTQVLTAATCAPSAENRQPWVFVVVRSPEARAELGRLTRKAWEGGGRRHSEDRLSPSLLADVDRGAMGGVSAAPVLVVVCVDTDRCHPRTIASSIFPAVQNMLLAAGALGLGSALTTLPTLFGDEISELLSLPGNVEPIAVIPLGWPARPLGPPRREPLSANTHDERYGRTWPGG